MNFKGHPFDGLSGVEACKRIYSPNKSYNEDAEEIGDILGGPANLASMEVHIDKERIDPFPNGTNYLVKIKDIKKTRFFKENFKTRAIGGTAFLSLENDEIIISATGVLRDGLNYLIEFWDFEKGEYKKDDRP